MAELRMLNVTWFYFMFRNLQYRDLFLFVIVVIHVMADDYDVYYYAVSDNVKDLWLFFYILYLFV